MSCSRCIRHALAIVVLAVCVMVGTEGARPDQAVAIEHPPVDWDTLDMIPERGWGVANQNPNETQTETLDVLVYDMVQSGDKMFVGGAFLDVQASRQSTPISQSYLAAFDIETGDWVDSFRPSFDRAVYALEVLPNGSVLVGGEFENVNGTTRRGLVALNSETGEIDPSFAGAVDRPWSSRRATVRDMKVEPDGQIYVAGSFSHLDGAGGSRTQVSKTGRFANPAGVLDASWKPIVAGGPVWGLDTDPSRNEVALSGFFTSVNGEANTGNFHVVDDATGATVAGKIELVRNVPQTQPEVWDVVYGDDIIFAIGEQHINQVLDADDHEMLGWHVTGSPTPGDWAPRGWQAGGAFQAGERIGDVMIIGCHCTYSQDNHYESFTGRATTRHNVMAYDAKTGRHIESFDADVDSPGDGHWAAASDTEGCLWIGGDYHVGGDENGEPHWLGGFGRLCSPTPPIVVENPGDLVNHLSDEVSLQLEATGGKNAVYRYSASGLPAGLSLDSQSGLISGTLDQVGSGPVTVTVEAVVGEGLTATITFDWAVMDSIAPVIDPIGRTVVPDTAPLLIQLSATDAEHAALTWSATGLPDGAIIDAETGLISGRSTEGSSTVTVTVTDLVGLTDEATFELVVVSVDRRPAITSVSDFWQVRGSYFMGWEFETTDTLQLTHLGAHDTNNNGRLDNQGPTTVALLNPATQQTLATVDIPANTPIEQGFAYAPLDQPITLTPNTPYIVAAEISGEPAAYRGDTTFDPAITYLGYAYKRGSEPGWTNVRGTVTERYFGGSFLTAEDPTPVLEPIQPITSAVGTTVTVQPQATVTNAPATWTADGLPTGTAIDTATGEISGAPTEIGSFDVQVRVADTSGFSATTPFTWLVVDSDPPTLAAMDNRVVAEFDTFSIQPRALSDEPDLTWNATGLPDGLAIDPNTGEISGVTSPDGEFTITVTASDIVGLEGQVSFVLTILDRPSTNAITAHANFESLAGDYFMGWEFEITDTLQLTHLGAHDTNNNGRLDNQGPTTVALLNPATQQTLATVDIPANTPIEQGFAYAPLDQPITLTPNTPYIVAAEISGEPAATGGDASFGPGITYVGHAYKSGSAPGWTDQRGPSQNAYFGATFRLLGDRPNLNDPAILDPDALVTAGATWKFDDSGTDLGTEWRASNFDDATWVEGQAEFGFGDGDEATTWARGNVTYYARHAFEFSGTKPASLELDLAADDGAVVYLNGVEVLRDNLPPGPITADTSALGWRSGTDERLRSHVIAADALVEGRNVVAVEVHNVWRNNNDLSFDLRLAPSEQVGRQAFVGPLVQAGASWAYANSTDGEPVGWTTGLDPDQSGTAEFGFGDDDETTVLESGHDAYYFTHSFDVADAGAVERLALGLAADDGAVAYLNGTEIYRVNMPEGSIEPTTRPLTWVAGADEKFKNVELSAEARSALVDGTNVIAVEVHNLWPGNADLSFDLYLEAR